MLRIRLVTVIYVCDNHARQPLCIYRDFHFIDRGSSASRRRRTRICSFYSQTSSSHSSPKPLQNPVDFRLPEHLRRRYHSGSCPKQPSSCVLFIRRTSTRRWWQVGLSGCSPRRTLKSSGALYRTRSFPTSPKWRSLTERDSSTSAHFPPLTNRPD